ncbi:hypothetical protein EW145_g8515, partial [Phellinidium pouzarii]
SVKPSSAVRMFDPLCEVQSDKASVEITSPFEGVVKTLLVQEGEVAKVGENLCLIEVDVDEGAAGATAREDTQDESMSQERTEHLAPGRGEVLASEAESELRRGAVLEKPVERQFHPFDPRARAQTGAKKPKSDASNVLALPSVRHFAKQNDVDIALLAPGSGKGGRVEKRDVENYLSRAAPSSGASAAASLEQEASSESDVVVELGRTRHAMWKAMVKSLEIPHFGRVLYSTYLDLTTLHNMLPLLNSHIPPHYLSEPPPEKPTAVNPSAVYPAPASPDVPLTGKYSRLTYLPFLLKTLSRAMLEWPLFRSSITPSSNNGSGAPSTSRPTLTIRPHADISIALSTPTGLYTPTLTRVDTQSVYALAARLAHVSALGRRTPCGLGPAEMPRAGRDAHALERRR